MSQPAATPASDDCYLVVTIGNADGNVGAR
jgi:hypothetical protein